MVSELWLYACQWTNVANSSALGVAGSAGSRKLVGTMRSSMIMSSIRATSDPLRDMHHFCSDNAQNLCRQPVFLSKP